MGCITVAHRDGAFVSPEQVNVISFVSAKEQEKDTLVNCSLENKGSSFGRQATLNHLVAREYGEEKRTSDFVVREKKY